MEEGEEEEEEEEKEEEEGEEEHLEPPKYGVDTDKQAQRAPPP